MTPSGTSSSSVLTIDIGLSAVKAAVFRPDGSLEALSEAGNDAVNHHGCCSEMNLPRLWELVCEATAGVFTGDVEKGSIAGVGLSAAGNGLYLLTPDGCDLLGVTSMDRRAGAFAEAWRKSPIGDRILEITGNHVWAGQPLPLLAHLREKGALPDDFHLLFCKDWLRHRLTGEYVTDLSDASAAGMLDLRTGEWSHEIFKDTGVGKFRLPRLTGSCQATGHVTRAASKESGIPEGIPVFAGGIDLALAAWADGSGAPDTIHITAGTWSINQLPCDGLEPSDVSRFLQVVTAPNGRDHTLVESSPTSAINLDVLCTLRGSSERDFIAWDDCLCGTPLDEDDPFYLPYPAGAWDLPGQSAEFRQIRVGMTHATFVAAVYDGIALGHTRQIRKFQERGSIRKLLVCGGMTRSDAWCQRLSDYSGLPMEVAENPHSSSWGAALCVFKGLEFETASAPRTGREYQPKPSHACAARYRRFAELMKNN